MRLFGLVGLLILLTSGCASIPSMTDSCESLVMSKIGECVEKAEVVNIPTYKEEDLPKDLISLPVIKPGSRELK